MTKGPPDKQQFLKLNFSDLRVSTVYPFGINMQVPKVKKVKKLPLRWGELKSHCSKKRNVFLHNLFHKTVAAQQIINIIICKYY